MGKGENIAELDLTGRLAVHFSGKGIQCAIVAVQVLKRIAPPRSISSRKAPWKLRAADQVNCCEKYIEETKCL